MHRQIMYEADVGMPTWSSVPIVAHNNHPPFARIGRWLVRRSGIFFCADSCLSVGDFEDAQGVGFGAMEMGVAIRPSVTQREADREDSSVMVLHWPCLGFRHERSGCTRCFVRSTRYCGTAGSLGIVWGRRGCGHFAAACIMNVACLSGTFLPGCNRSRRLG